jgi:hypothetical protein
MALLEVAMAQAGGDRGAGGGDGEWISVGSDDGSLHRYQRQLSMYGPRLCHV